jgi:hypothetical protein
MKIARARLGVLLVATAFVALAHAQSGRIVRFDRVLLLEATGKTSANVHVAPDHRKSR